MALLEEMPEFEKQRYGVMLNGMLDRIRGNPELMRKVRARAEENRLKAEAEAREKRWKAELELTAAG